MPSDQLRPAHRFLHVCYCCADPAPVLALLVEGLGWRETMRTPVEASDGALLGLDGEIVSAAAFVYDRRGPRVAPGIEVQQWVAPPAVGAPPGDPTAAGMQALGLASADAEATADRLVRHGCVTVGSGRSPFGDAWAIVRDPNGVTIDVVEDGSLADGEVRLRHLRMTCTDLAASSAWYRGLGFDAVGDAAVDDGAFVGMPGEAVGRMVRLRLPDEPFEAVLVSWSSPPSHGRHTAHPNQVGLFRTAVAVDDVRASYAAMLADGWTFDRAPMSVELKGTPVPDMWICFLRDPDGVPFELVERPRAAFT